MLASWAIFDKLDSLRMLATLPPQCVADIIMLDDQIQSGCYVRYWLLMRMLGLMMAAVKLLCLLDPKCYKERHELVSVSGVWAVFCKAFLTI